MTHPATDSLPVWPSGSSPVVQVTRSRSLGKCSRTAPDHVDGFGPIVDTPGARPVPAGLMRGDGGGSGLMAIPVQIRADGDVLVLEPGRGARRAALWAPGAWL